MRDLHDGSYEVEYVGKGIGDARINAQLVNAGGLHVDGGGVGEFKNYFDEPMTKREVAEQRANLPAVANTPWPAQVWLTTGKGVIW